MKINAMIGVIARSDAFIFLVGRIIRIFDK